MSRFNYAIIALLSILIGLTGCDDKEYDGGPVPVEYYLDIHFVRADGSSALNHQPRPEPADNSRNTTGAFSWSPTGLHSLLLGDTYKPFPIMLNISENGYQYLSFISLAEPDIEEKVIRHRFHSASIFHYKEGHDADMTTYWKFEGKQDHWWADCVGVTFDGQDYPVTDGHTVTITLPDAAE